MKEQQQQDVQQKSTLRYVKGTNYNCSTTVTLIQWAGLSPLISHTRNEPGFVILSRNTHMKCNTCMGCTVGNYVFKSDEDTEQY